MSSVGSDKLFFWECLSMDDGSWSCVKVLYSTCDSVLSAKWLIQIGTQVLEWSRLSPNFVHVQGDFFNWTPPEFARCWLKSN